MTEGILRRTLFEQTGGMYPELVTRGDLHVFLPPIGGMTLYIFGDPAAIHDPARPLTCRIHDECNGSDVFGSDICTCRPYLTHGIEECVRGAQSGGAGLIVYNRKEGRALGEVTKFLVYNARKRQPGGDQAPTYFARTECVAGVQDARFQQLMPDVLHWLGVGRIDRLVSMSNLKHDALIGAGIEIGERVPIPAELVPPDAQVEIEAKKAAGYFTPERWWMIPHAWWGVISRTIETRAGARGRCCAFAASAAAVRRAAQRMLQPGARFLLGGLDGPSRPAAADGRLRRAGRARSLSGLRPPFHARWRHFVFGGRDLVGGEAGRRARLDVARGPEQARARPSIWRSLPCCWMPGRGPNGVTAMPLRG